MMKLTIFSIILTCTSAAPIEPSRNDREADYREPPTNKYQHNTLTRQFNYPATVFNENEEVYNFSKLLDKQPSFSTDRVPKNFQHDYLSDNNAPNLKAVYFQEISPATRTFKNEPLQQASQQQVYNSRNQQQFEGVQPDQIKNNVGLQPESVTAPSISYKDPVSENEYNIQFNPSQYNFQPVVAPPRNFPQIVTPGPRNLPQNRLNTEQVNHPRIVSTKTESTSNREFSGGTRSVFDKQPEPPAFYKTPFPNYLEGQFDPQTLNQPLSFPAYQFDRTSNLGKSVEAANILYSSNNIPSHTLQPVDTIDRQIIPAPQEFLNTAITIGNNIFERIPGYKLTTNLVGFLGNVTRLGVNFINTQFPLINPALLNPNQIDIYPNRPLIIPSYDYSPMPTPPTYTTTAAPTYISNGSPPLSVNSAEDTQAVVDPLSSNENSQLENDLRTSQENTYNSQQQEYYESPQTSQENHYSSQENTHNSHYSQEDQRTPQNEPKDSLTKKDHKDSQERIDYNAPAVAGDILPEDEFDFGDDDDKIDTKAIKTIVG